MLDYLKKLKDDPEGPFDAIFFMPTDEEGQVHIEANQLKDPGEPIGGSPMGHTYEVILFKKSLFSFYFYLRSSKEIISSHISI